MPLTLEQRLEFHAGRVSQATESGHKAAANGDLVLAAINMRTAFSNALVAGLIEWRRNRPCVVRHLEDATRIALMERAHAVGSDLRDRWIGIPIAAMLTYLLHNEFNRELVGYFPSYDQWPSIGVEGSVVPDVALIMMMLDGRVDHEFRRYVERMRRNRRVKLQVDTYVNYAEIVSRVRAGHSMDLVVRTAEELYRVRKKNSYYSSSSIDGGGPDNELVVDFRLATILKWAEARSAQLPVVETVHRWRW